MTSTQITASTLVNDSPLNMHNLRVHKCQEPQCSGDWNL